MLQPYLFKHDPQRNRETDQWSPSDRVWSGRGEVRGGNPGHGISGEPNTKSQRYTSLYNSLSKEKVLLSSSTTWSSSDTCFHVSGRTTQYRNRDVPPGEDGVSGSQCLPRPLPLRCGNFPDGPFGKGDCHSTPPPGPVYNVQRPPPHHLWTQVKDGPGCEPRQYLLDRGHKTPAHEPPLGEDTPTTLHTTRPPPKSGRGDSSTNPVRQLEVSREVVYRSSRDSSTSLFPVTP